VKHEKQRAVGHALLHFPIFVLDRVPSVKNERVPAVKTLPADRYLLHRRVHPALDVKEALGEAGFFDDVEPALDASFEDGDAVVE
jgi:hypothetical protein